ncbi:hypothetical protein H9P43_005775 [Blastocladiella emersonii ATCC 22665]|nr:hypothetical protein H9P43_005775 [Blastocladiella emersonii ATCC 22665]
MLRFGDYGELPAFANETNKKLDKLVREKETRLARVSSELEEQTARTDALVQHMKNVKQQLAQIQNLNDARGREIETEEHLKAVAERESGRLTSDMKRIARESEEIAEQSSSTQNTIYRTSEKVAKLKALLKSEERELEDWLKVQQEKEEDNLILLKYSKEDDQRIKELSLQIEKLMGEVNEKKASLSQSVTETQVSQMEVERIAEEFRKLHQERQDLLGQWEQAILGMRKRDQQIEKAQLHYEDLKARLSQEVERRKKIEEKQAFLDKQIAIKGDTEKSIQTLDRLVSKLKGDQVEANQLLVSFQDELEALRTHLNRTSNDVQSKRNEVKNLQDEVRAKTNQVASEGDRAKQLQAKLKSVLAGTGSKEEKAAELQGYLRQDEQRSKELDKQIKSLKDQAFRHNQDVFRLKQEEKTLGAEISGAHAAIRNLGSKIAKLDQESIQQRSLIYNQEYTLQQLERKVKRAQGDRTDEEQAALNKKIAELTEQYDRAVESHQLLSTQLKRAQDDLRHAKRRLEVLTKEKAGVTEQIDDLNLYIASASSQLSAKVREKEEVMVEESILRLEVKKLRTFMHSRADEVLALESRQVQLQLALEERTQEIQLHKTMLRAQIKAAEEERFSAAAELREKTNQVALMKTRYEILMAQIAGGRGDEDADGGPGGEDRSQAYYIIRAAQEREELQRQGDALDAKIQRAEKEIKAMENTLLLLNSRNDKFKAQLNAADVSPHDLEHRAYLQAQYDAAMTTYRQKQDVLAGLQLELQQTEQVLASMSNEEAREQAVVEQLQAQIATLNRGIAEAQTKKTRAEQVVLKLSKELRRSRGQPVSQLADEEIDMKAREVKEVTNFVLFKADEVLERAEDTVAARDRMHAILSDLGVAPPSRPLTRASNVSSMPGSRAPSRMQPTPGMRGGGPHLAAIPGTPTGPRHAGSNGAPASPTAGRGAAPNPARGLASATPTSGTRPAALSISFDAAAASKSPSSPRPGHHSPGTASPKAYSPLPVSKRMMAASTATGKPVTPTPGMQDLVGIGTLPLLPKASPNHVSSGRTTPASPHAGGASGRSSVARGVSRTSRPGSTASNR